MATALIQSDPPGAFVTLDDELLGVTPMLMDGLMGGNSYAIAVYAVGHEPEAFTLTAEPGFHHEMTFQLVAAGVPDAVAVAENSGGGNPLAVDTSSTVPVDPVNTDIIPDNVEPVDIEPVDVQPDTGPDTIEQPDTQETPDVQPDDMASTNVPATTEELIAMLTTEGIDMASLASSGSLSSLDTENTGVAGAESATGGQVESGVPLTADAGTQQVMVFSDVSSTSGGTVTESGDTYSSRSSSEILEVLNEKRSAITFIYNKHLRTDPMLMGTVEIEMVIQPSGRVSDVRIVQSSTYNPAFELELARSIETWRFGSVDENEGPLTVQYPFSFSP
jgi:TonB family protein